MYRFLLVMLAFSIFILQGTQLYAQRNGAFGQAWQYLEKYYNDGLSQAGVVGSSIMFIHNDQILRTSNYGLADLETKRPIDKQTIYHWASNTKMLTGIAIMQLRDRGFLSLDDPIIEYIPELKVIHNPYSDMHNVTIAHLMSHSAGFRAPTWPWKDWEKSWHPHEPKHWKQLVAMFPYTEILFKPGSKYSYSNLGIVFLGRVIELLSGDDYEVYIDKNILKPLEMYSSYFDYTPYHLLKHRSNNYFIENGEMTTNGFDFDTGITVSNGGLNAPLGDIAKYVSFLIGSGEKQAAYDVILRRSSLEEMWETQQEVSSDSTIKESIGLCFFILQTETDALRVVGHTGGQKGFITFIYVHPPSRTGCMVAFNTSIWIQDEGEWRNLTRDLSQGLRMRFFEDIIPLFLGN